MRSLPSRAGAFDPVDLAGSTTPREGTPDSPLEIQILLNRLDDAHSLVDVAANLASGMHAKLVAHFAQVVPYPLPLKSPPVPVELVARILKEQVLDDLWDRQFTGTSATLYLCRDRAETLREALKPESLVVMGTKRRWWRTSEERLARQLTRDGHRVLLVRVPQRCPGIDG
ncbi:MAG: hypothetical protein ABL995_13310 [Bryobacteraceae bacterium]